MIDLRVRRVKRMTADVEYAAADLEGAAQSADLAFALDEAFIARIVPRQSQPRWAGANDQEFTLNHNRIRQLSSEIHYRRTQPRRPPHLPKRIRRCGVSA